MKQVKNLAYDERLKRLNILSIQDRVLRGDLIQAYKILTGKIDVEATHFFELSNEAVGMKLIITDLAIYLLSNKWW